MRAAVTERFGGIDRIVVRDVPRPVPGMSALQVLRDEARLGPGARVLVNGAAGGIGSFAIQIAKAWGATVSAGKIVVRP